MKSSHRGNVSCQFHAGKACLSVGYKQRPVIPSLAKLPDPSFQARAHTHTHTPQTQYSSYRIWEKRKKKSPQSPPPSRRLPLTPRLPSSGQPRRAGGGGGEREEKRRKWVAFQRRLGAGGGEAVGRRSSSPAGQGAEEGPGLRALGPKNQDAPGASHAAKLGASLPLGWANPSGAALCFDRAGRRRRADRRAGEPS